MTGNKGQHGTNFVGMTVRHRKAGLCAVVREMSHVEYAEAMKGFDYRNREDHEKIDAVHQSVFTLRDAEGNIFKCGRDKFSVPRNI